MSRVPLIAGNWKMHKTGTESQETARQLVESCRNIEHAQIMIAPAFLSLPLVARVVEKTNVAVGAQNLHYEKQGAFTGEVSAGMIRAAGAAYVIIGHSERRQFFGDDDTVICKKISAAVTAGLIPVFCIGETKRQRDEEKTFLVLDKQVSDGLKGFGPDELKHLVVAYEPVWAIGTGETASVEQVDEVHQFLRSLLGKRFSAGFAQRVRLLYGGSVNPGNVKELMGIKDVDGALVGGASLDADTFMDIINYKS